jgi:hypothetical protein
MASLRTPTPIEDSIPGIRILKVASCVTSDTVYVAGPVKSWVVSNQTTTDAVSASYSATTKLFTIVVANTPDIHLWIMS